MPIFLNRSSFLVLLRYVSLKLMIPGDVPLQRYYTMQRHRLQNRRRESLRRFSLLFFNLNTFYGQTVPIS